MARVRPTPLVGHPSRSPGVGFLILEPTPKCYGTWFESDQLPWSDTRRVPMCPTPVKCVPHAETPHWGAVRADGKRPCQQLIECAVPLLELSCRNPYPWGPAHQPFAVIAPGRHPLPAV